MQMPSLARLFNQFCPAGTSRHLNYSSSLGEHLRTHLKDILVMIRVQGSTISQGECCPNLRSSASWIPESMGKWSVGMGCKHPVIYICSRCRLKGIHFRSDTNRTGAEGLSFYYPRLLHCMNQMLAVVLLSQHRVLSSKTKDLMLHVVPDV